MDAVPLGPDLVLGFVVALGAVLGARCWSGGGEVMLLGVWASSHKGWSGGVGRWACGTSCPAHL
jgi:hypothetical protein